jgi:hypothetical protein
MTNPALPLMAMVTTRRPRPQPTPVSVAFRGPEGLHPPDLALPFQTLARAISRHLHLAPTATAPLPRPLAHHQSP